jgi:O-antigen biosynthesis protein WbqP
MKPPDGLLDRPLFSHEVSVETLELLKMNCLCSLCIAIVAMIPLFFPSLVIGIFVRRASPGPALYWSDRVGRNNKIFKTPKFRAMGVGTLAVATHLLTDVATFLTSIVSFLRTATFDELPQLRSIPKGDTNLVDLSRAIFNQNNLNALRTAHGVRQLFRGMIGWARVNDRDEPPILERSS